jgi:hypothetical protein
LEKLRRKFLEEAEADDFQENISQAIVYVSMETNNSIEDIMHWPINRFYVVSENITAINKIKYSSGKSSGFGKTMR